ncbi:toxic anion resistance protein [Actinokineospora sp. NBRC 105648]|uniref:toxic anion resistance protein n=1 Tax=Actinokineospora sp. NBRC 105648 TaxID=3032206 RepID=UPI0024A3034E|nr:toxic anion resistance protein [Actinokineospora sp. NBRC 105648]GLZ40399.1 toxic anion resistance protein [Actinokineospora sp. NBRC 105648]
MSELALTPPDPVEPVPVERAAGLIPLDDQTRVAAAERAERFSAELSALDPRSPGFTDKVDELLSVGEADMRVAATIAGGLLDRSVDALAGAQGRRPGPEQRITTSLAELRRAVTELDPGGLPTTQRKLLGLIPMGNQAKRLLDRYRAANTPVNLLVVDLRTRQDQLRRDNAAIKGERARLWENMSRLSESAAFAKALDTAVERQAGVLDYADPAAANSLRADVLHPVRQRHQDILTQLAVSAQGYLALDLLRRNNDELIRGVERACSTTVSALRIALVVSGALANQRDVLDEVAALRGTTEGLIRTNADLLALQTDEIRKASTDPAVGVATIKESFDQIYRAIDAVDEFRAGATQSMATTVAALTGELRRAEDHLRRSHATEITGEA